MKFDISELKARTTCVEVARSLGLPIENSGDRCRSPFHAGNNPSSMVVYNDYFYSFSDNFGGDQIDLIAEMEFNGNRGLAIEKLAQMVGLAPEFHYFEWQKESNTIEGQVERYHSQLRQYDREYLYNRRITEETIRRLKIGYDKGRLYIPYMKNGKPYNWISRAMSDKGPKYFKRPNTEFTDPAPWGMHTLRYESDTIYITEGAFDALSIDQSGFPVLSTMGSSFGVKALPQVVNICKQYKNIILAFDNDKSGREFARKFGTVLINAWLKFQIAIIPEPYKDVSDYYVVGNEIKDLKVEDGLSFLAAELEDVEELRTFMKQISRFCDGIEIATVLSNAQNFTTMQLKAANKEANEAPKELVIANEILEKHQLLFREREGFYEWDGVKWAIRSELVIKNLVTQAWGRFATSFRTNAVYNLMQSLVPCATEFNTRPVLTFSNGTLELETGVFRASDPLDYCSVQVMYPYDKTAECPKWKQFLMDVMLGDKDDIRVLQGSAGYVLFPDCRFHKIIALIGNGGNGKSVYMETLRHVFGEKNCTTVEPDKLTNEFYPINLKNSLLNLATEINADFSRVESMLKQISAGETIMGCYKGMGHIQFNPRCKLIFACNEMPHASVVKGLDRRLVFVEFLAKFVEKPDPNNLYEKKMDVSLKDKLFEELPGIFNWVYEGYQTLMKDNSFFVAKKQKQYIRQFREISNPIMVFCEEHEFRGRMTKDDIYQLFSGWCERTGNRRLSRESFFPKFKDQIGKENLIEHRVRTSNGKRPIVIDFLEDSQSEGELVVGGSASWKVL